MASTINSVIKGVNTSLDNLNIRIRDSLVNFAAEAELSESFWPVESIVTYSKKLTDSHNAMDTKTGFFTAPFDGAYTFLFASRFSCEYDGYMYARRNQSLYHIFTCKKPNDARVLPFLTIHFTMQLFAGDQVGIETSKYIKLHRMPEMKFSGFLLPSF